MRRPVFVARERDARGHEGATRVSLGESPVIHARRGVRTRLRWVDEGHAYEAIEPAPELVAAHAETLARWYNAKENASMMVGSGAMTTAHVVAFYGELALAGGAGLLCFVDGELVGDVDLRNVHDSTAEFAVMIGDSSRQGLGLGRIFVTMLHVLAFRDLGLARVYVQAKPENALLQRLVRRLGYEVDSTPEARSHAADDGVVTMSISADAFRANGGRAWAAVEGSDTVCHA